ncbi:MAG: flagellar hook-length control protein FliK [Pseudomonadota bacterium]
MSQVGPINTLLPTTPVAANPQQTAQNVQTFLQNNPNLPAQITRILSAQSIQVQTALGSIHLSVEGANQLTVGSKWTLQNINNGQKLNLLPETSQQQSTNKALSSQASQTQPRLSAHILPHTSNIPARLSNTATANKTSETLTTKLQAYRQDAASKQNSLSNVFKTLSHLSNINSNTLPNGSQHKNLQNVAQHILGFRITPNVTPSQFQHALRGSGLFHEAQQATQNSTFKGLSSESLFQAAQNSPNSIRNYNIFNLKNLFFQLNALSVKTGDTKSSPALTLAENAPPLPEADGPLHPQKAQGVVNSEDTQNTLFSKLAEHTTQAVSRLKLLQAASLPGLETDASQTENTKIQLNFELPVTLNHEDTAILALRIAREHNSDRSDADGNAYGWSIDFALDTEETGPIDAHIHLKQTQTKITIWAGAQHFAELLNSQSETLRAHVAEQGLEINHLQILHGRRPDLKKYAQIAQGRYLDHNL